MLNITTATSRTRIRRRARQRSSTITFILCFPVAVSRTFTAIGTINDGNDCGESDEGYGGDDEGLMNEPILIFWSFGDGLRGSTWSHAHSGSHCDYALAFGLRSVESVSWLMAIYPQYIPPHGGSREMTLGCDAVARMNGWAGSVFFTLKQWHFRNSKCSDPTGELPHMRKWGYLDMRAKT